MVVSTTDQQGRITVIDALRGFTLLGILIVHTHNLWGDFWVLQPASNPIVDFSDRSFYYLISTFMNGKFGSIFAILFGVSFYIMLCRTEAKGVDFRLQFVWRMIILIFIGWMHELIYTWEALITYGLLGIPLILFYKFNKRTILIVAICCLVINPFYHELKDIFLPQFSLQTENVVKIEDNNSSDETFETFLTDHKQYSTVKRMEYFIQHGPFGTFGLFLLGLFLGKVKFFENTERKKHLYQKIFWISVGIFCLYGFIRKLSYHPDYKTLFDIFDELFRNYFLTSAIVSGFILLYFTKVRLLLDYLVPYGKMGLTNYISQSVFGLFVFAPFFMGLNTQGITIRLMIALLFYAAQVFVCTWYLKYFIYGPFEWFWRSATYLQWVPFRKKTK